MFWTGSLAASLARPNGLFLVLVSTCLSTLGNVVGHSLLRLPFLKITISFLTGCPFSLLCWFILLFLSWGTQSSILRPLVYLSDLMWSCGLQVLLTPTFISPAQTFPFDFRPIHLTAPLTFDISTVLSPRHLKLNVSGSELMSSHLYLNMFTPDFPVLEMEALLFQLLRATTLKSMTLTPLFHAPHLIHHQIIIAISWTYSQSPASARQLSYTLVQHPLHLSPGPVCCWTCSCPLSSAQ